MENVYVQYIFRLARRNCSNVYNRNDVFISHLLGPANTASDEHKVQSIVELNDVVNNLLTLDYFNYGDISVFIDYFSSI